MNNLSSIRCDFEPATFLIISEEVAPLIYYSHFVSIAAALGISLLVFANNPKSLVAQLFLAFASVFSMWSLLDVLLWATNDPGIVMFAWASQVLAEPLMYAIAFYLFFVFINKRIPTFSLNAAIATIFLPLVIFLPTSLNVDTVYLSFCETDEGILAMYYTYFFNICMILLITVTAVRNIPKLKSNHKRSAIVFIVGLIIFLFSFTIANVISSFTDDWTISQYGLFGMPIFAGLIAYSIVQFQAFKIQIAGAQVLVVVLLALVGSLLLVRSEYHTLITIITLTMTSMAGLLLVHSVKAEFEQRLRLEDLTTKLEQANVRLKALDMQKSEFLSIASHQLRSPLTSIRGYASMLIEGSFGPVQAKIKEPLERIEASAKLMTLAVEDYLNVSRIESGNMKYDLTDFDLATEIERVSDDMRPTALRQGLILLYRTKLQGKTIVHADIGKTVQIAHNLINNAIKYTPKGTITILIHDDITKKEVYLDVIDTGVGMSQDTIDILFQKFSRAKDANKVNTTGTGLGLYVAGKMAEAMKGSVTAHSKGAGKGSCFTLTLPLEM